MNIPPEQQPDRMRQAPEAGFNPYQPSQTADLQLPQGVPSWLAKTWLNTKQFIEEPAPQIDTWSNAAGQIYRWLVLFHVCNLLPILTLWKMCLRWRTLVLVFLLAMLFATGIALAVAAIFDFVTKHVTWTIN